MAGWLHPAYHLRVLRGVRHAAREAKLNVVTFAAAIQGFVPAWHAEGCLDPEVLDGVILFGSSFGPQTDSERHGFLKSLGSLPRCAVATDLPGASTVEVENESGIAETVRHLVRHHGHRRLAYIGGPDDDEDAQARLRGFRAAIVSHDLREEECHILPGDFTLVGGQRAVRVLLDERRVPLDAVDAVVAANDSLARGCLDALAARGIRVPWQLAVVGFDDALVAQQAPVPLTTVHQPLYRVGRQAVELLMAQMQGASPQSAVLPARLVVRRSCGCLEGMGRLQLSPADLRRRGGQVFDIAVLERRETVLAEIRQVTRDRIVGLSKGWEARLFSTLLDELKGRSADAFRVQLEDDLDRIIEHRGAPSVFQEVISTLWRHLVPSALADPALRTAIEGLLDGARLATTSATLRGQASELEATQNLGYMVGETCVALAGTSTLQDVATVVQRRFPALGIRRLAVAVYPRGQVADAITEVLWFDGGPVLLENTTMSASALPGAVMAPQAGSEVIVMPLHTRGAVFGLLCMEARPPSEFVCVTLRDALNVVLHRLRIVDQA